jgi:hypothetical protein
MQSTVGPQLLSSGLLRFVATDETHRLVGNQQTFFIDTRTGTLQGSDFYTVLRQLERESSLPDITTPCGGGFDYPHLSPASRRRRRKGKSGI